MHVLDVDDGVAMVYSVRFINQGHWFVAGGDSGYIHVYSCHSKEEITRFNVNGCSSILSLATHPTRPYLLSACTDGVVKLWDWNNGWNCIRTVHSTAGPIQVKFSPKDTNTFTSCCTGSKMKVGILFPLCYCFSLCG